MHCTHTHPACLADIIGVLGTIDERQSETALRFQAKIQYVNTALKQVGVSCARIDWRAGSHTIWVYAYLMFPAILLYSTAFLPSYSDVWSTSLLINTHAAKAPTNCNCCENYQISSM